MLRALVVGLGAVGKVIAAALIRAGADVTVFVRSQRRDEVAQGFESVQLHGVSRWSSESHVQVKLMRVVSSVAELTPGFDQVWLCIPSTSLDDSQLVEVVLRSAPRTCISMAPVLTEAATSAVRAAASPERFVQGLVGFLAFEDATHSRVTVYHPPLSPSRFGGESSRVFQVVEALRRGGLPAGYVDDAVRTLALSTAMLMPVVAGIEVANWSLVEFRRKDSTALAAAAIREATLLVAKSHGMDPPLVSRCWFGSLLSYGLVIAQHMLPFDLEAFIHRHFVKVGPQTRMMFAQWIAVAEHSELSVPHLVKLAEGIGAVPGDDASPDQGM